MGSTLQEAAVEAQTSLMRPRTGWPWAGRGKYEVSQKKGCPGWVGRGLGELPFSTLPPS